MAKNFETICLGCIILLGIAVIAYAEKATELYIPLGQSPGLSDEYNVIGRIDAVDSQKRSLTVVGSAGSFTVHTTDDTLIFLDNSRLRQPNRYGTFSDVKPSIRVEVRFEAGKRHRPAEWIKLQIDQKDKND
jgi:hypothetical protein